MHIKTSLLSGRHEQSQPSRESLLDKSGLHTTSLVSEYQLSPSIGSQLGFPTGFYSLPLNKAAQEIWTKTGTTKIPQWLHKAFKISPFIPFQECS